MLRMSSQNILNGVAHLDALPGQFAALLVRIDALTAGGAAPVLADFGTIKLTGKNGAEYSVPLEATQVINNLDLGQVESSIGAAGGNPITLSALIVASRSGDGNIFDIAQNDNYQVEVDLNNISVANVASGTITLSGIPQDGIQQYSPNMFVHSPQISANTTDVITLKYNNISKLYITNLTNCDSLMIERAGEMVVNDSFSALLALSNMDSRIESAFSTGLAIDFNRSGSMSEALSDEIVLHLKAGAGGSANPTIVPVSNVYGASKMARSSALVQAKAEKKFKLKSANSDEVLVARSVS